MIYWHVERGSVCIHSRLRRCSCSQGAGMIEGGLRHDSEMKIARQYADSHGQKRRGVRRLQVARLPAAAAAEGDRGAPALSAGSRKPEAGRIRLKPGRAAVNGPNDRRGRTRSGRNCVCSAEMLSFECISAITLDQHLEAIAGAMREIG